MIQIAMTQDQYTKARAAICASSEVVGHVEKGDLSGSFVTKQVAMAYYFLPAANELQLNVTARSGLEARMASEDQIKEHIQQLLAKV
jgi:hypothetical protein